MARGTFQGNLQGTPSRPLEMLTSSKAVTASYAETASRLGVGKVGDSGNPVYFNNGIPVADSKTKGIVDWVTNNSGSISGVTGSSADVAVRVNNLEGKSGSWDSASKWVGDNSASLLNPATLIISKSLGVPSAGNISYNPFKSASITIAVPSTPGHIGAAPANHTHSTSQVNGLDAFTASVKSDLAEISGKTGSYAPKDDYLPIGGGTITGSLIIEKDLTVQGTTVSIDAQNLNVKDKLILVASGSNTRAAADGAGIAVPTASAGEGGAARIQYDGTNNIFTASVGFKAPSFTGSLRGNVTGTASFATSASKAISSSYANTATSASEATHAVSASEAVHAITASHAVNAKTALTASYLEGGASLVVNTASYAKTASVAQKVAWTAVDGRPGFFTASFVAGAFSGVQFNPTGGFAQVKVPSTTTHITGLDAVTASVKQMVAKSASWDNVANTASAAYTAASQALATASVAQKEAESASYWKTEASKSAASTSTFKTTAQTAATQANAASQSAKNAASAANTASGSAKTAATVATNWSLSASNAANIANAASASAQSASNAANVASQSAKTAATVAQGWVTSASKAAQDAEEYRDTASGSMEDARFYSSQAATNATLSSTYAVQSSASAQLAAASASAAASSATNAATYATRAQQSASNAHTSKNLAAASASAAATYATQASQSAYTAAQAVIPATTAANAASASAKNSAASASASAALLYKNLGSTVQPIYLTTNGPALCDPYSSASVKSASYALVAESVKDGAGLVVNTASYALDAAIKYGGHYTPSASGATAKGSTAARTYLKTVSVDGKGHVVGFTTGSESNDGVTSIAITTASNYVTVDNAAAVTSTGTRKIDLSAATKGKVESGSAAHTWITANSGNISSATSSAHTHGNKTFLDSVESKFLPITGGTVTGDVAISANKNLTVGGNLYVNGTASYVNTQDLVVKDKLVLLSSGSTTQALADGAGIAIQTASATTVANAEKAAARFQYRSSDNKFTASVGIVAPDFTGNLTGTASHATKADSVNGISAATITGSITAAINALVNTSGSAWKTDNNTTYTFANGTKGSTGFSVTPSGGSAQNVTVGLAQQAASASILAASANADRPVALLETSSATAGAVIYDTAVTFNPSSNILKVTNISATNVTASTGFRGNLVGNVTGTSSYASYAAEAPGPYVAYNFGNGYLVTTNITGSTSTMFRFKIEGNSYKGTEDPINTDIQFYSYNNAQLLSASGRHNGYDFGDVVAMVYQGYVCLWFQQPSSYQTYAVSCQIRNSNGHLKECVTSITNAAKPTTNIQREVTITPRKATDATTAINALVTASGSVWAADTKVTSAANHYTPAKAGTSGSTTARYYIKTIDVDAKGHVTGVTTGNETVTNTDTKVTAVGNHYTPAQSTAKSVSSGQAVFGIGVDAAGHVVSVTGSNTITSASRAASAASADSATVATGLGVAANTSASVAAAINAKWTYNENTIKGVKVTSASRADSAASATTANTASYVTWANISGKPSSFTPAEHNHYRLVTQGDQRATGSTPNDYSNNLIFKGLKQTSVIGNPSSDMYSYLIGLRGWQDSSGGDSWEFAFNNSGINVRHGATTWGSWSTLITSDNTGSWATAAANSHTHSNKAVLDGITAADTASWDGKWTYNEATIKAVKVNSASRADSAASATSATTATKLVGTSGSTSIPVYINAGVPTACAGTVITDAERKSWVTASNRAQAADDGLTTPLYGNQGEQTNVVYRGAFKIADASGGNIVIDIIDDEVPSVPSSPETAYGAGVRTKLSIWGGLILNVAGTVEFDSDSGAPFIWSENSVDIEAGGTYEFNCIQYEAGGDIYGIITKYSES